MQRATGTLSSQEERELLELTRSCYINLSQAYAGMGEPGKGAEGTTKLYEHRGQQAVKADYEQAVQVVEENLGKRAASLSDLDADGRSHSSCLFADIASGLHRLR